jgi:lipopolysaccharide export system permease protein
MPIVWRYLLRAYFQVFGLAVSGFIAVLLVMQFHEIARFAASSASKGVVALYALYQIPSILFYAIPIAALIASMLLFQRLSSSHELTALRASGLGLKPIVQPLILASLLLCFVNLTVVCEVTPVCRTLSKRLVYETTAVNPLILLQKDGMVKLKDLYINVKKFQAGKSARDVVAVINNHTHGKLSLMIAKELSLQGDTLHGDHVTFISSVGANQDGKGYDHLVIENQTTMSTKADHLSHFIESAEWVTNVDYLTLRMLLAKELVEKGGKQGGGIRRVHEEIAKRFSLAIAPLTFTLIGIAFGMGIGRNRSRKGLFWAVGLSLFFMLCFVSAKSFRHTPLLALTAYLLPHPIILACTMRPLKRISEGVE